MKHIPALVAPLLATSVLAVVLAGPARAESASLPDPVGDATSFHHDPEPPPCGTSTVESTDRNDIRRLVVRHTRHRIHLTLRVSGLTPAANTSVQFRVTTPRRSWDVSLDQFGRRSEVTLADPPRIPDPPPTDECGAFGVGVVVRTCDGATGLVDRAHGRVQVSLPRRCVRTPRWVRVGASISGWLDDTSYSDSWAPAGREEGGWFDPVLGPAVRADAPAG